MVNNLYRLIYPDFIRTAQVASGDELAAPPDVSVISPEVWAIMCEQAGGEDKLLVSLGVKYEVSETEVEKPSERDGAEIS